MRDVKNPGAFGNLRTLNMCFASEGLKTQDSIIALLFESFDQSPARTNLKSLAFISIPCIDTKLLDSIAKTFPQLTELELTSTARIDTDCCLVCVEASLGCTRYSPIPDHYLDAQMLAVNAFMFIFHRTPTESTFSMLLSSEILCCVFSSSKESGRVVPGNIPVRCVCARGAHYSC